MRLNTLQDGDPIIIQISINKRFADFPSVVLGLRGEGILAEAVRIDGKVLRFDSSDVRLDLSLIRQDKPPVVWKNVKCSTELVDKAVVYHIVAFAEGFESNRRQAFRLFLGIDGVAQIGTNRKALQVIVKDVSENGFSFVSSEDIDNVLNVPVRLVFTDSGQSHSLMGLVVRKVAISERKIIYGCKLGVDNINLAKYIHLKQRQQMSLNKNNAVYKARDILAQSLKEKGLAEKNALQSANSDHGKGTHTSLKEKPKRAINEVDKPERRAVFDNGRSDRNV